MKKIISFVFVSLFVSSLFAGDLQSICAALAKTPNTLGNFTQIKTISSNGRQLKSSGDFIISTEGIMWNTVKPFPSKLVVTEKSMIQVAANGKKNVMNGSDNQIFKNISQTLRSVFAGNSDDLEKNFSVTFTEKPDGLWTVLLQPKDSTIASVMQTLELSGTEKNNQVTLLSLELQETSNNKIRYEFSNHKYPKELTADEKENFFVN